MHEVRLLGIGRMNPPEQLIYVNKNEKNEIKKLKITKNSPFQLQNQNDEEL
jgi:hypothetical protein